MRPGAPAGGACGGLWGATADALARGAAQARAFQGGSKRANCLDGPPCWRGHYGRLAGQREHGQESADWSN